MNSLWLVVTALAAFAVAYRLYGAFLAARVAVLNDKRLTPAHRLRDDIDYQPTRRLVLFGVHFAAIAGPGPLVGPVLAAQWGFLPGFSWIVIGSCLAGGVHDFVILLASVRGDGLSLPKIARRLLGPISGTATILATLFIIIVTLAGVAKVVVIALSESSWGMFTIIVTIPAALITGLWMNKIRPGRVAEASLIGVTLVLLGVFLGKPFDASTARHWLLFPDWQLAIILPVYAAIASILPVWVLLCPRDYLSSYMKIGVIVLLAIGILFAAPPLKMPATTPFIHGGGPVVPGTVWPFVCIVVMCGALSGFHALISSGTTPKMVEKESDILPVAYGAMLLEGFVSVTALVAACALEPGDYFKINIAEKKYAAVAAEVQSTTGLDMRTKEFDALQESTGEHNLAGKTGGAVTLAVGMAKVFSALPGMSTLMSYWYHFVIMFEALFILTLLETGTRVARFIFQETIQQYLPERVASNRGVGIALNITLSVAVCALWGYLLYSGKFSTLWGMMGIANQLLATIALAVGTTYLLQNAPRRRYAFCTGIPLAFAVATVFTAGVQSIQRWQAELADLPSGSADAFYLKLVSIMAAAMLVLSAVVVLDSARRWYQLLRGPVRERVEATELSPP
jgi:carbon starvation protein